MEDIKVFGKKVKPVTAGAIVAGSGAAIWFAYRQHKSAAAAASTSPSSLDPVTGLPFSQDNQVDPLTGMEYLAEAQEYGSVSAAETAVAGESSLDYSSVYGTGGGGVVGSSGGQALVPANTVPGTTYATNAAWAQAVEAGLAEVGYASTDISAALGRYLANLPETADQATIVEAAIAEFGLPPVGSFQVILAPTTGTAGSGNTGTGTSDGGGTGTGTGSTPVSTAPKPVTVAPSGFRVVSVTNHDNVNLAWNRLVPPSGQGPVTGYVIAYGPTSGSQQYKQYVSAGDTAATVAGVGAGSAGKHYFELWATPANTNGPHAGPIEATTTKS